jgi:hypothetical protein
MDFNGNKNRQFQLMITGEKRPAVKINQKLGWRFQADGV